MLDADPAKPYGATIAHRPFRETAGGFQKISCSP
jgi:hypothetical protein